MVPATVANLSAQGSSCELAIALISTTKAVFTPTYAGDVQGYHSTLVDASLEIASCKQGLVDGVVVEGFQIAFFNTLAKRDQKLPPSEVQLFIHQAYTNSEVFERAASARGLHARRIDSVAFVTTPTAHSTKLMEIVLPPATADYTLRGAVDMGGNANSDYNYLYRFGAGPAEYFLIDYKGPINTSSPGEILFGANSYWAQHSQAASYPSLNMHGANITVTLRFPT
jgi:hypothetical protein